MYCKLNLTKTFGNMSCGTRSASCISQELSSPRQISTVNSRYSGHAWDFVKCPYQRESVIAGVISSQTSIAGDLNLSIIASVRNSGVSARRELTVLRNGELWNHYTPVIEAKKF